MSTRPIATRQGVQALVPMPGGNIAVVNEGAVAGSASNAAEEFYASDGAGNVHFWGFTAIPTGLYIVHGSGATPAAAKAAQGTLGIVDTTGKLTLAAGLDALGGAVTIDTANGVRQLFLSPDGASPTPPAVAVLGDIFLGQTGLLWLCTVAGNPATWQSVLTGRKFSYTLLDNVGATDLDATNLAWADTLHGVIIDYVLWRGATPDVETGSIHLAFGGASAPAVLNDAVFTVDPGVTFTAALAANVVTLKYATTATGQNATMKITVREVW